MSDIIVVKNRSVSYTGKGYDDAHDESYIKISTSFRNGTLRKLQGAPLSAFLDVALHEADEPPGVTLERISEETGVSYRHLLRIMPQLCKETYCAISGTDERGNQIYRVAAYAWFGTAKPLDRASDRASAPNSKKSHDKMSHDIGAIVVDVSVQNSRTDSKQQTTNTQTRDILRACGVMGKPLQGLSTRVSPETARLWQEWIENAPSNLHNPPGVIVNALLADPDARPALRAMKPESKRKFKISGRLAKAKDENESPPVLCARSQSG